MQAIEASAGRAVAGPAATVTLEHFSDPWCWWSWGIEPVLRRLREVYGDQLRFITRMGGIFDDRSQWLVKYGQDDASLPRWVGECMEVTGMPVNAHYMGTAGVLSTYPACRAIKAAELQSHENAERLLRLMLESSCVYGLNVSKDSVIRQSARAAGLDPDRLLHDMETPEVELAFAADRAAMEASGASFLWSKITGPEGESEVIEEVFTAKPYEEAIDRLAGGGLHKRAPVDLLEYASRLEGTLCAREAAEVFRTTLDDAERRLSKLAQAGHFSVTALPFGDFYGYRKVPRETLSIQEVQLSHVLEQFDGGATADVSVLIRRAVQGLYTEVATQPNKEYHFPLGREALLFVGYPEPDIDRLPHTATESFAGVGYPHQAGALQPGARVVDIGSGSGTDVLFAALKVGAAGEVIGFDITPAQIEKARRAIAEMGVKNVRIEEADVTAIPLPDNSVDVVTSNGVLNLVPDKPRAFREIFRILRRGGVLQVADIVTREDVAKACGLSPQLWADCIGGAAVEEDYISAVRDAGFVDLEVLGRIDYFGQSRNENTRRLTRTFGAESIVLRARRP